MIICTIADAPVSRPDQRNNVVGESALLLGRPTCEHAGERRAGQQHILREEPHDAV